MDVLKALKNLRMKWRRRETKEQQFQESLREKYKGNYVPSCYEKSVGIDIGFGTCSQDVDKLIKMLETEHKKHERI